MMMGKLLLNFWLFIGYFGTSSGQQICICVTQGFCSLANGIGTDGSGAVDPRIVNNQSTALPNIVDGLTVASSGLTSNATSQNSCPNNLERCCPSNGFSCGIRYPPVAGSKPPQLGQAAYGAYPWQAVLLGVGDVYIGSGAVIDNFHILTAAHKVSTAGTLVKVRVGEYDASANNETFPALEFGVAKIFLNPNFVPSSLRNGIAIVRLNASIPFGTFPTVTNACLSSVQPNAGRCFVSGWGKNDFNAGAYQPIQKEVDLPIVNGTNCQNNLRTTRLGANFSLDTTSFLCAGGEANKDACTGDGGAPLVCFSGGRWFVVGLVAWGIGCGTANVPGVYINVASFINWIQATTKS